MKKFMLLILTFVSLGIMSCSGTYNGPYFVSIEFEKSMPVNLLEYITGEAAPLANLNYNPNDSSWNIVSTLGSSDLIYPGIDYVLVVNMSQPSAIIDYFIFQSVTLTGPDGQHKYIVGNETYYFITNSDYTKIYLPITIPEDAEDEISYTVDAVQYIDGSTIKDVRKEAGSQDSISLQIQSIFNGVSVSVDVSAQNEGIVLYESVESQEYVSTLISDSIEDMGGMTGYCGTGFTSFPIGSDVCIPPDEEVVDIDGSNNGNSYIAYTFYIKNTGEVPVDLSTTMNLLSPTEGAEEAIRVRVIYNNTSTTFAKIQTSLGNTPGELEPLTTSFYDANTVMHEKIATFSPNEVIKMTVVVWYEGEDADHTINIVGQMINLEVVFSVIVVQEN